MNALNLQINFKKIDIEPSDSFLYLDFKIFLSTMFSSFLSSGFIHFLSDEPLNVSHFMLL
jgi:hypothetical protein